MVVANKEHNACALIMNKSRRRLLSATWARTFSHHIIQDETSFGLFDYRRLALPESAWMARDKSNK